MSSIAPDGRFSIRGAVALAFRLVARTWGRLVVLMVAQTVVASASAIVLALLLAPVSTLAARVAGFLIQEIVVAVTTGAIVTVCIAAAEGRPCGLGTALAAAGRRFGVMTVLCFLQGVAIAIGLVLLIVPGVVILVLLGAAAPACMVEGRGIFDSFSRSMALSEGHRWGLFGLLTLLGLVTVLGLVALLAPLLRADALTISICGLGVVALIAVFFVALVLPTAIYVALRACAPRDELGPALPSAL